MNKRILTFLCPVLLTGGFMLFSCSYNGADSRQDKQNPANALIFRLADNQPEGYPTVIGDRKFAELVKERTNGELIIEVFPDGELGDEKSMVEQTRFGMVDFVRASTNILTDINPDINALTLPYLYRDKEHMFKVLDGPIGDSIRESMRDGNLLGLCWFDSGARSFYNTKKEIKSPEDMKGLKIRVQETKLMTDLVRYLGGEPVQMVYGEVYSGMRTGVIEGAENNFPSYVSASHNEAAKYFTVDEHTRAPEMILINLGVFNSLTADQRQILRESALEAAWAEREEWSKQETEYERIAIAAGTTVTRLSPEQRQAFVDAVAPIYDDYKEYAEIVRQIRDTQ